MSVSLQSLRDHADQVLDTAIEQALFGAAPISIVKSPPGAGKTFLVECAASVAVTAPAGMRIAIVTPGVSQLYDIARRLLEYQLPRLELAHAQHRVLPADLVGKISAFSGWNQNLNIGPGVVVTNAHLLAANFHHLGTNAFDLMILDEAYQLAAGDYLPIAYMAPRSLMVGDPGQLNPVNSADTTNLEVSPHKIHWPTPAYILDRFPNTPIYGLPVTRRLLPDTSDLVQTAFYSDLPFQSVAEPSKRRLGFRVPGLERGVDDALDAIANGASLVAITLPGTAPMHEEADLELSTLMARIADRVLLRQAEWIGERTLTEEDIGCIEPHVIAGGAVRDGLRQLGRASIQVDTVERWQGLQMPVSVVRHPLSLSNDPTAFDLEAGRWCVSLSRHQIGCIVVARETVHGVIDDYVHGCDTVAAGARDTTWAGFEAHRMIWNALRDRGRIFAL